MALHGYQCGVVGSGAWPSGVIALLVCSREQEGQTRQGLGATPDPRVNLPAVVEGVSLTVVAKVLAYFRVIGSQLG